MLKEFFYLQRSDRIAVITLLTVAVLAIIVMRIGGNWLPTENTPVDSIRLSGRAPHDRYGRSPYRYSEPSREPYAPSEATAERFVFDPNTADSTALLRLGLKPWQVHSIYKYRAKGGVFRRPEDFARLYGLTAGQYRRLLPYIRISDDYRPASEVYGDRQKSVSSGAPGHDTVGYPRKLSAGQTVHLNRADTNALKTVPGIGSYYARAIVRYRSRLGGFTHPGQLREIDGFPEEAVPYFRTDTADIVKINLNKATVQQMRRHPYLNFYQARAIADYRRLHGDLHSLSELSLLKEFPPEVIRRLQPYVTF